MNTRRAEADLVRLPSIESFASAGSDTTTVAAAEVASAFAGFGAALSGSPAGAGWPPEHEHAHPEQWQL